MSSKIIAMGLCGALLVGCGGSNSPNHELNEYTVSDFEGRIVSEDTLAGTWVAVWMTFRGSKEGEEKNATR